MEFSNSDKFLHGQHSQNSVETILKQCINLNYIKSYISNFRIGKIGYTNKEQFYSPFLIQFFDDVKWVLFTTTSMRTDRIKGQQWDAINLKDIDSSIVKAFLIFPDSVPSSEYEKFNTQNLKYKNQCEYSALDAIICQNELFNLIENYAIKDKNLGYKKDIQGNNFEHRVADILSNKENLKKWQTNDNIIVGLHYNIFVNIINYFELFEPKTIKDIVATADKNQIGRLPSGGNPKTDVLINVEYNNGEIKIYTISCKRSSKQTVSVHEYKADTFADVLCKDDLALRDLLNKFQEAGSLKKYGMENEILLTEKLKNYRKKLFYWVLGGRGGDGDPKTQQADYVLTYDNSYDTVCIHSLEEYYKILTDNNVKGNFGTLFYWTYPSKQRGKRIQLKCKLLK